MNFDYKNTTYSINSFPKDQNRSLKPWNSADELVLSYLDTLLDKSSKIAISNESQGFLSICLNQYSPINSINTETQKRAIEYNWQQNQLSNSNKRLVNPLEKLTNKIDFGIIKIPKSLGLFELYLHQLHGSLDTDGLILCTFMTKYFTPQLITITTKYFEQVEQSKAHKKARLLILRKKKERIDEELIRNIDYKGESIKQYYGVFSAQNIDYATQFLIEELKIDSKEEIILDLASGNGILAKVALSLCPSAELHLLDDSYLAIASSKLNLDSKKCTFHHQNSLAIFEDNKFDLVISNPPFHNGHQINMSIPLEMFQQVARCLKESGRFIMVSNKHLNYKVHLEKSFSLVIVKNQNAKFIVYECRLTSTPTQLIN